MSSSKRIPWDDLVIGEEYIIKKNGVMYKGILNFHYRRTFNDDEPLIFMDVTPNPENKTDVHFYQWNEYYDWNEIKDNARKARNAFEQRSLNQILKRVVNEEFEW